VFSSLQATVEFLLAIAVFGAIAFAAIDAMRYSAPAYVNASKQTKLLWVSLLVVASAIAFLQIPPPLGFGGGAVNIFGAAIVALTLYYNITVKKALAAAEPRRGSRPPERGGW
jgi:hypothetical protein